ncbi:glycosyltransferase family 4 protein [Sphingomonas sp. AOB5]|uniref:glycosyltransferase family 4 protein n=1 Tax=Sphingomonas sp. AOB5 TaxID=3034017 RepID=UPI0023F9BC49|nr:glycosyltransferase family 4 protein [Sphingomonas sp. AOB5]MDF7775449.1 glycosyltransferase family 4 protein [Sphingomonas sp. AOB5]
MITVGTTQRSYPAVRNFLGGESEEVHYRRVGNAFRYPEHLLFKAFGYTEPLIGNLHWGGRGCDVLHFFNRVSFDNRPWVTTFETVLPRWDQLRPRLIPLGLGLLARDSCKRLIALSECTRDFQLAFLDAHPKHRERIAPKITVLHPPQALLTDTPRSAPAADEAIHFAFVGVDFFRKGGREVLRAFDRLLEGGAPIRLTIVSAMHHGDYASRTTGEDLAEAQQLIAKWPGRIEQFGRLANDGVLELFRTAHVALLPTWADTYGYSVLEAQAAGCPVLSTDVRALPEINDDRAGWVIPVPKDGRGNAEIGTVAEREDFSRLLEVGIARAVEAILADPGSIAMRSAASLARIREHHDPAAHAARLRDIYLEALG